MLSRHGAEQYPGDSAVMLYVNHFDTIIPEIAEWCLLLDAISSVQAYQKRMLGTILPSVGISTHRRERFYNNVSRST